MKNNDDEKENTRLGKDKEETILNQICLWIQISCPPSSSSLLFLLKVEKAKRKERRRRNCVKDLHNIKFYITLLVLVVFQILTLTRTKAARFFLSSSLPYNRALENSLTITWCFYHLEFLKNHAPFFLSLLELLLLLLFFSLYSSSWILKPLGVLV